MTPETLGSFAIEHELGRGGSGVVYAARMGVAEVALKVLRHDEAPTAKERERFLAEARNLARVTHPGVVRVVSVGELPDGRPFLAMERLRGATLAERLLMQRLSVERALLLFEQLAGAVSALHAVGLIHRDIKPENIMLASAVSAGGERLVLLDFGIARGIDDAASTTTQAGLQRGTPAYMAPERFFGARATVASDVYETAVVLYAMLTGELPWKDPRNPRDRMNPRPPAALGVLLPAGLEAALMHALGPEPEHRPQDIDALVSGVRRSAWDGETQLAPPSGAGLRAARRADGTTAAMGPRRWLIAAGMAAAFAAAVAVAIVATSRQRERSRPAAVAPLPAAVAPSSPSPVSPSGSGSASGAGLPPPVVTPLAVVPEPAVAPAPAPAAPAPAAKKASRRVGAASASGAGAATGRATGARSGAGTATGSGAGAGSASGATSGTSAASGAATATASGAALADCHRIASLYCTDEFRATEGTLAGKLCETMRAQVKDWEAFPPAARASQATWCHDAYPQMAAAVAERLRQFRDGIGPP